MVAERAGIPCLCVSYLDVPEVLSGARRGGDSHVAADPGGWTQGLHW